MNNEKSNYEIAQEEVRNAIKDTKIVESEISTGTSYFEGKKRLCKVLKSKKSLSIEINVNLDAETEKKYNLSKISFSTAKAKHLGTMKYFTNINDPKELKPLICAMVKSFKSEQAVLKAAQDLANAQ